ncbi:nucleotidyltransferase domain-containing protein [Thermosulfurimonas marina]|uniref:nucleotidyltransferase domain-containing protein n=1 Tax=Thermosulfurimonas marina TaxID=2047767 RepID=UPI00144AF768|nr:nucleotidyltransferase domain-containing protein [Thermosulfurimonas marina]
MRALGLRNYQAILFGSFARGDFGETSDVDLLIISEELPRDLRERMEVLSRARLVAPRVEPVGWRPEEWEARKERGDPFIKILEEEGIPLS